MGSARAGDLQMVDFFLHKLKTPSDQLVLQAIFELNKRHPEKTSMLLDLPARDVKAYSQACRRTVKALVESGNTEAALRIVRKTRVDKMNDTNKERVIKICPSVIVVAEILSRSSEVNEVMEQILSLVPSDPKIVSRTVPLAIDLSFRCSEQVPFCKALIAHIMENFPEARDEVRELVGQSSKRFLKTASRADSEEEIYRVFQVFSYLGLKLEGKGRSGASRGWDLIMNRLIPTIPVEGSWSVASLVERCWQVKAELDRCNGGLYSHSVVWGSITQHLLNRWGTLALLPLLLPGPAILQPPLAGTDHFGRQASRCN